MEKQQIPTFPATENMGLYPEEAEFAPAEAEDEEEVRPRPTFDNTIKIITKSALMKKTSQSIVN